MPYGKTRVRQRLTAVSKGCWRYGTPKLPLIKASCPTVVELCLEDIDWRAGTLVVRDERLGANIKLQLDIVSFFDIDFERPAEVLADQCAGCASRLDRGVEILIHN